MTLAETGPVTPKTGADTPKTGSVAPKTGLERLTACAGEQTAELPRI